MYREQIYHSQGHLPPTGRRFRSRSRHGGQSGSKSRGQTGSGERKQDNKPSTLPRPKRSYDREPIYNYNNNSRPGAVIKINLPVVYPFPISNACSRNFNKLIILF